MLKTLLVIFVLLLVAAPAASAPPLPPQVIALQHQMKTLQARVTVLEAQRLTDAAHAKDYSDCMFAFTRDNDAGLFQIINLMAQEMGHPPVTAPAKWNDNGACARVGISR